MSELFRGINVWKMALLKAFLLCVIAGLNTLQTSMNGVEWSALTPTQKLLVYVGVIISLAGSLVAFCDKSMQRVQEGKSMLETGTTQFIQKP